MISVDTCAWLRFTGREFFAWSTRCDVEYVLSFGFCRRKVNINLRLAIGSKAKGRRKVKTTQKRDMITTAFGKQSSS